MQQEVPTHSILSCSQYISKLESYLLTQSMKINIHNKVKLLAVSIVLIISTSVHFHCKWPQTELKYLREDMLDDRSQSLHSLVSLDEHPLQLSDGLLFSLRLLFTLAGSCRGCSVDSGGFRCVLWAVCGFENRSGARSRSSGAWDTVGSFKICHWCHWWVPIHHIWHLKWIQVKAP